MHIHNAERKRLTPIMICAITRDDVYLLDWSGNRVGFTRIIYEFSWEKASIEKQKRGLMHRTINIHEDGHHTKIECNLCLTHSNKATNRKFLKICREEKSPSMSLKIKLRNCPRSWEIVLEKEKGAGVKGDKVPHHVHFRDDIHHFKCSDIKVQLSFWYASK